MVGTARTNSAVEMLESKSLFFRYQVWCIPLPLLVLSPWMTPKMLGYFDGVLKLRVSQTKVKQILKSKTVLLWINRGNNIGFVIYGPRNLELARVWLR